MELNDNLISNFIEVILSDYNDTTQNKNQNPIANHVQKPWIKATRAILSIFFVKHSWIGPWISRID